MNDYVKSLIREELAHQIEQVVQTHADSHSSDISAENLKQLLFDSDYLRRDIEKVLELFGI